MKTDREHVLEKGISKLEQLDKMMVDEMSFPRIHSFYILGGETLTSLQLVKLKLLAYRRLIITLLRKYSLIICLPVCV